MTEGLRAALISLGSVSSRWTYEAMGHYFDHVDNLNIKNFQINLGAKESEVLYKGEPMEEYDCVYAKGSFRYADVLSAIVSKLKDRSFMPIRGRAFSVGHDKVLSHIQMQRHKVPMPKTHLTSSVKAAKEILKGMNYPIIMKLPRGTQGKGVMFAESYASASSLLDTLEALRQPVMIQEFIDTNGEDIRAIVVGDKVVAAMRRKAQSGESRSNIHAGGGAEPITIDSKTAAIAIKAAQSIGADICGVDILESARGPVVLEVNLSPGLQGVTKATKINIPDKIAKYLYDETTKRSEVSKTKQTESILNDAGVEQCEQSDAKEIILNLDMRNNKILLPELVTQITKFAEEDEVVMRIKKGELSIKQMNNK